MLLIAAWRRPLGVPHPAIFSRPLARSHAHAFGHTHARTLTRRRTAQSRPLDEDLAEGLRKCFISQLPPADKACVPTVREAGGSNVTNYPPSPRRTD